MLVVHFLGLGMGVGTSIGFIFLGIASSKLEKDEAKKFTLNSFTLSRMGQIGMVLLILSGIYLILPYWGSLGSTPLLIAKLALVLILVVLLVALHMITEKIKKGDDARMRQIPGLGRIVLLLVITIIIFAVLVFN